METAAQRLLDEGIRSVAVCLLHSYANPRHEIRIGEILEQRIPGLSLSLSSRLLAETGEYERTSTTVINSYIRPLVARYLGRLDQGLRDLGVGVPLTVMQSNGGRASVRLAAEEPIHCVESGTGRRRGRSSPPGGAAGPAQRSDPGHGGDHGQILHHRGGGAAACP